MSEDDTARWTGEGGQPPVHSYAWFLAEVARADRDELRELWPLAVATLGEADASRLWQEALSASDASET
jgi:hypothetical protein